MFEEYHEPSDTLSHVHFPGVCSGARQRSLWNKLAPGLSIARELTFWIGLCYLGVYTLPGSNLNALNRRLENSLCL